MATFAETMLSKYETLLQTSAGLDTVSVDGQSVRYDAAGGSETAVHVGWVLCTHHFHARKTALVGA
jgi:hypothetical protein